MSETVVFSQLSRKFIDENDATPDAAQQVVYYSLAIGHHLGVIDCLEAALSCPWPEYRMDRHAGGGQYGAAQDGGRAEVRRDRHRRQPHCDARQRL